MLPAKLFSTFVRFSTWFCQNCDFIQQLTNYNVFVWISYDHKSFAAPLEPQVPFRRRWVTGNATFRQNSMVVRSLQPAPADSQIGALPKRRWEKTIQTVIPFKSVPN